MTAAWPDPGFHDGVAEKFYHSYRALSSTGVGEILDCPALYRYYADVPEAREDTEASALGSAVHAYVLEGEAAFLERYFITVANFTRAKKEDKAVAMAEEARGKRQIKAGDYDLVRHIADAVGACADAAAILGAAEARERSALFTRDGIACKARFDIDAVSNMGLIADLKCLSDPRPHRFLSGDYGRQRAVQASFYAVAHGLVTGKPMPDFAWIVVPVEPPFKRRVWVAQASDALLKFGDGEVRSALAIYKDCMATGDWPGWDETIRMMEPPAYWGAQEVQHGE